MSRTIGTRSRRAGISWAGAARTGFTGLARRLTLPNSKTTQQLLQIGAFALFAVMFSRNPRFFKKLHRMTTFIALVFKYRHLKISY
jgi:hypothetical protein